MGRRVFSGPPNSTRLSGRDTHEVGPGPGKPSTEIQSLHPKWFSHLIWDRAIQLGFQKRYVRERPPWSDADDAALMDFAQEQSAKTIASWLHRTEGAVLERFSVTS